MHYFSALFGKELYMFRTDFLSTIRSLNTVFTPIDICHTEMLNFDILLTVHPSIFISVINQLNAQNFCFTVTLFHASTCFEHIYSSSGGQNYITQPLVSSHV